MSCTSTNQVAIKNDKDGKIAKALESILNDIDRTIIAVHINNGSFAIWYKNNKENYVDNYAPVQSIYDLDTNAFKFFIGKYNEYLELSVQKQEIKNHTETSGAFSGIAAKKEARAYTGDILTEINNINLSLSPENRISKERMIQETINYIRNEMINRAKTDANKKQLEEIEIAEKERDTAKANYNSLIDNNATDEELDDAERLMSEKSLAFTEKCKSVIRRNRNGKNKDYVALYEQVSMTTDEYNKLQSDKTAPIEVGKRTADWFNEVFKLQKMLDIAKLFNKSTLESNQDWESLNEEDITESDTAFNKDIEESKDQMSKGWEDNITTSFLKYYNSRLTLYLSNLYNRFSNIVDETKVEKEINKNKSFQQLLKDRTKDAKYLKSSDYLGVPTKMDYRYVVNQITNMMDGSSVQAFYDSVKYIAENIPSLYGLGEFVNEMYNDSKFAYFAFNQLRRPLVAKTMIRINGENIEAVNSNSEAFAKSALINQLFNSSNFTFVSSYEEDDATLQNKIDSILNKQKDNKAFIDGEQIYREDFEEKLSDRQYIFKLISNYLTKHFPNLDTSIIENVFYSNENDAINVARQFSSIIGNYQSAIKLSNESRNEVLAKFRASYAEYMKKKDNYNEALKSGDYNAVEPEEPLFDSDDIKSADRVKAIIKLANLCIKLIPVNTKLNSSNAEGSMSSNLLKSNYLTNMIERIRNSLNNGGDGIEVLKDFLTQKKYQTGEYEYSSILFGVTDSLGRQITNGMFIKNKTLPNQPATYSINKEFFKGFNISLFDGNQNGEENDGKVYANMSPGDFLMAQMKAFAKPVRYDGQTQDDVNNFMNIIMRVPSDAPNTYMVQLPRFKYTDLYNSKNRESVNYLNSLKDSLNKYSNATIDNFDLITKSNEYINKKSRVTKKGNTLSISDTLDYLYNKKQDEKLVRTSRFGIEKNNKFYVPYLSYDKKLIIWYEYDIEDNNYYISNGHLVSLVGANKPDDKSNSGSASSFTGVRKLTDEDFESIRNSFSQSAFDKPKVEKVKKDTKYETDNAYEIVKTYIDENNQFFLQKGYNSGAIKREFNKDNAIFNAFKTNLVSELNEFVNQLNSVCEVTNDGQFITKTNSKDLFRILHTDKDGNIVVNGKLAGSVFKFTKLFEVGGYKVNDEIVKLFNIYGNSNSLLIPTNDGRLKVNTSTNPLFRVSNTATGKQLVYINNNRTAEINNIVENWLDKYINYIISESENYNNIINNEMNNVNIEDFALNTTLAYMQFDDIFEGSSKFYKDAQTFLKRAKETQMGGSIYGAYDFSTPIGAQLQYAKGPDGNNVTVNVKHIGELTLLNGFKAVTIENTINYSSKDFLDNMYKKVKRIVLESTENDKIAEDIANQIAYGYGRPYEGQPKKPDPTKFNDAQSYITFEEFIRRRVADGTYEEYKDLIDILAEENADLSKLDVSKFQKLIEVQKNVYYDLMYDPITGRHYPRQIKNAEFVLIPSLLPKDSSLHTLYEVMKKHGIDQVNTAETSKAAQRNILRFWDNNGVPHTEEFENSLTDNVIENYYYSNLYQQVVNESHLVDSDNKAGIQIMKKLLDNYSTLKEENQNRINVIQDAFSTNIESSFKEFIFSMGWTFRNGKIVNRKNPDGKLDFTEYLKRARYEAQRLGLDKNVLDFLTPNEFGVLEMPIQLNNVSTKLEAIAQSLFNNRITRQTLPGWHAVQVSGIGIADDLEYRPNDENYMQIKIAPWSKAIRDMLVEKGEEETLKFIKEQKLDKQIIYRIPTEGKQSVIVAEIVGFVNPAYDSTILVPKEWVTQSGSDFDNDSIYSIRHEVNRDGTRISTELSKDGYYEYSRYIRKYISILDENNTEFINTKNEELEKIKRKLDDLKTRIEQQKSFGELKYQIDNIINKKGNNKLSDDIRKLVWKERRDLEKTLDLDEEVSKLMPTRIFGIKNNPNIEISTEDREKLDRLIDLYMALNSLAETINIGPNAFEVKTADIKELRDNARKERLDIFESIANELGLMSFEEFNSQNTYQKLSTEQRNNIIADSMIDIMLSDDSVEEMLGRSNFDELTRSKQINEDLSGQTFASYSPYNPFNQLKFMQNAIDGRKLKAFSVNRDTLNSINNKLHTMITDAYAPIVIYEKSKYNEEFIRKSFSVDDERSNSEFIAVKHNKLGWSKTNRNVIGRLMLPYSSQTTAHILDAIKEGALINENEYTFGTFKTLLDVGIDTDTAIAWLMQPAITRIVNHYNSNNSMFIGESGNPISQTLKDIALELKLKNITNNSTLEQVFKAFLSDERVQKLHPEFTIKEKDENGNEKVVPITTTNLSKRNFPIVRSILKDRLASVKEDVTTDDMLINDFITVMQFDRFHKLSDKIEKLGQVLRPEAAGAKQTIRATREVSTKVNEYRDPKNAMNAYLYCERTIRDEKGDETTERIPVVNAIYPVDGTTSGYKYIDYFYKYVIQTSVDINKQLFPTEEDDFVELMNSVVEAVGHDVSDEQYQIIKKSVINNVQNQISILLSPVKLFTNNLFAVPDYEKLEKENSVHYWEGEKGRIFGYTAAPNNIGKIDRQLFNNPTPEFIEKYKELTPLQKVAFMQTNLEGDGRGIFDVIDFRAQIQNEFKNKGYSRNRLYFNDTIYLIDEVYDKFRQAFYNKNPLIRLAAIDLVKYAFIVEGFDFKKNNITKIIPNDVIKYDIKNRGLDIVREFNTQFDVQFLGQRKREIIDNVIRSHSEFLTPIRIGYRSKSKDKVNLGDLFRECSDSNGLVVIPSTSRYVSLLTHIEGTSQYKLINDYSTGTYRKCLYKVYRTANVPATFLIPLTFLDANEVSEQTINPQYKSDYILTQDYYNEIIKSYVSAWSFIDKYKEESGLDTIEKQLNSVKTSKEYNDVVSQKDKYRQGRYDKTKAILNDNMKDVLIREIESAQRDNDLGKERVITEFVDSINEYLDHIIETGNSALVMTTNPYLMRILNLKSKGSQVAVNVFNDNLVTPVLLTRCDNKYFVKRINGDPIRNSDINAENELYYEKWYKERKIIPKSPIEPYIIKVEPYIEPELKESIEKETSNDDDFSVIEEIESAVRPDPLSTLDETKQIDVASYIAHKIQYEATRENNPNGLAATTIKGFKYQGIYINDDKSIKAHRNSIYKLALSYYRNKASKLIGQINEFEIYDKETFSIDDPELYNRIQNHDGDFNRLLRLVLEASTMSENVAVLKDIPVQGEDTETDKLIKDILQVTNSVSENPKIRKAFTNIFNIYLAKEVSSNAQVRAQILNVTDNFGRIDNLAKWLSDASELPHKQIQIVVKLMNKTISKAQIEGREAARAFETKFDSLLQGLNDEQRKAFMDKIIDDKGRLVRPYTDNFIEDMDKYEKELEDIAINKGYDSKEYFLKALQYEKWKYNNTNQLLPDEFYKSKIALQEIVYKQAGDLFIEYRRLTNRLRDFDDIESLTDEEKEEYDKINNLRDMLLSDYNEDMSLKSDDEIVKIAALNQYNKDIAQLYNKYYVREKTDDWERTLNYSLNIINNFNVSHPDLTLDEKLEYDEYRVSYEWIKNNTVKFLNLDARNEISKAYTALNSEKTDNPGTDFSKIKESHKEKGDLYDAFGEIVGSVFTEEERKQILDEILNKMYNDGMGYDDRFADTQLIKDVENTDILSDKFWESRIIDSSEKDPEVIQNKKEIITKINKIISKGIKKETGRIDFETLYDHCTTSELNELINLYGELRIIYSARKRSNGETLADVSKAKVFVNRTNTKAFNEQYTKYKTFNGTKKYYFENIFCQCDLNGVPITTKGDKYLPSDLIYGYIELAKDKNGKYYHPEYIDKKKTDARNLLDKNVEYKPTQHYDDEIRKVQKECDEIFKKAISEGKDEKTAYELAQKHDNDFFYANHYYNKYTHKYELLPIWTKLEVKKDGNLSGKYDYYPVQKENYLRKPKTVNPKYKEFSYNYRTDTGKYNNSAAKFTSGSKEEEMFNYLSSLMTQFNLGYRNNRFIQEGYAPRLRQVEPDASWYWNQAMSVFGWQKRNYSDRQFKEHIDFVHDTEARMPMLELIKAKGYKPLIKVQPQGSMTDEDYAKYKQEVKEENKKLAEENLKIDNALFSKDWKTVFAEFIYNATLFEARNSCKDIAYLTIEDLKDRKSRRVNSFGKLTNDLVGQTREQELFENYVRRVIFNQFKEISPYAKVADFFQNSASAKYMIGNVISGAANVNTGLVNILGEIISAQYLDRKDYAYGLKEYRSNLLNIIADSYKPNATSRVSAYLKYFDVVDTDNRKELVNGENKFNIVKASQALNDALYIFQSGGEHFMQNSVLLGMIHSHRVYRDVFTDKDVVGTFEDYTQNIEYLALQELTKDNSVYNSIINNIMAEIRKDAQKQKDFSELRRNLPQEFFALIKDRNTRKELINKFDEIRKEYLKTARQEFNDFKTLDSQFEFENGYITLSSTAIIDTDQVAYFKNKVLSVNKKIHGVYDKIGAAYIEKKWWGSLVMQYHKHLYPGFMKRYRVKGYYNESRGTNEKGSYTSFVQWLFSDFKNYKKTRAERISDHGDDISKLVSAYESVKTVINCLANSMIDLKLNYKSLPVWEQRNIKRVYGDLCGIAAAFVFSFLLYLGWDDDEIKENNFVASALYIFDRLLTETIAYSPTGAYSEAKVLYSSPVAGAGGIQDLFKLVDLTYKYFTDSDFNPEYDRGIYKGRNKFGVIIEKNIPAYRQYQRFRRMGKSNNYYRVGESNVSTKLAKNLAREINPND